MSKNTDINVGTKVTFDCSKGTQSGKVTGIFTCITNGRRHAMVEIDHELPGIVHLVPVDELKTSQYTFLSGAMNPFNDAGDRRFWAIKSP